MILYDSNFLDDYEINFLLDKWDDSISEFSNIAINFFFVDFIKHKIDISKLHHGNFSKINLERIRLQKYNESFTQIEEYHGHINHHNYVMFLNDDFDGGELEFENGLKIKPKKGSLAYFNNDERHRVLPCKGNRFVFTLLGNTEAELNFKTKKKHII
jgi:hypothetical protein